MVYGGSATVSSYAGDFGALYDEAVSSVVNNLRKEYLEEVVRGTALGKLKTVDRIGHIDYDSLAKVANVWGLWAKIAKGVPVHKARI